MDALLFLAKVSDWRHDNKHNDTQHNDSQNMTFSITPLSVCDTQHKGLICDTQNK